MLTWPERQNSRVPPFFGDAQAGVPVRAVDAGCAGTRESVSTLLSTVGEPDSPDDGREGRPDARDAALAFERFEQRRFLAALVRAGAGVRVTDRNRSRVPRMFLPR